MDFMIFDENIDADQKVRNSTEVGLCGKTSVARAPQKYQSDLPK